MALPNSSRKIISDGNSFFLISAPLYFLFLIFAFSTFCFILHIPTNPFIFIISFVFIITACGLQNTRNKLVSILFIIFAISIPILIVMFVNDISYDGNAYHKLAAGLIKEQKWNPIYQKFDDIVNATGLFDRKQWSHFYDSYPKADYIINAAIYSFTGNIECGKAYHIISMISAFFIIFFIGCEITNLKKWQIACIAISLTVNPVTVGQVFTNYNDGFMCQLVMIVCVEFLYIYKKLGEKINPFHYVNIVVSIIIAVNLKYSGMILMFIPCIVFLLSVIFSKVDLKSKIVKKIIIGYVAIVVLSLGIFGVTSYGHNAIFYHNPFYTMIGEGKEDVLSPMVPISYQGLSDFNKFFFSFFSIYSNDHYTGEIVPKIPFSMHKSEFRNSLISVDTRMGGWGIFYSGLFVLSVLYFAFRIIKNKKFDRLSILYAICLVVVFVPPIFVTDLNAARYWPFPFLFAAWLLYALFSDSNDNSIMEKLGIVVSVITALNFIPAGGGDIYYIYRSLSQRKNYSIVEDYVKENAGTENDFVYGFYGSIYNLHDKGINPSRIIMYDSETEKIPKTVDIFSSSVALPQEQESVEN